MNTIRRSLVAISLMLEACSEGEPRSFAATDGGSDATMCTSSAQCDDRIPCTRDLCVVGGVCEHLADNSMCVSPQVCMVGVGCAAPGARRCARTADCEDNIPCTRDTCLVDGVCRNAPQDEMCPTGQRCLATGCGTGMTTPGACRMASDCDDRFDCTEDTCSASGQCINVAQNARCGAGRVCRAGMGCVAERSCSSDADCDDHMRCNGIERCSELACSAGTPINCDDGMACTIDSCVEGDAGMCAHAMDPSCISMSVRSGIYTISPRVQYMCDAIGIPVVNLDRSFFQFSYVGGMLTVNGVPCMNGMQGPTPTGRSFSVSCRHPGTCHEDYRLEGTFTDDSHFNAVFSLTFVEAAPGLCGIAPNCTNQRWVVMGALQ